ncbi:MAG: AmmeMemoRadiSam system radical SAM enzyme [Chlorobiaceae bacterium]|nr:AmmeMemoRadiSam system radical SAM enzyme [Chlorobiaceae bacterium]
MHAAGFYHEASDGTLQCDLCRHYCRIRPDRSGLCRVRRIVDGRLCSLSFGHALAQTGEPVEQLPLYHFKPGTSTWAFGTPGCNFTSADCLNLESSRSGRDEVDIPFTSPGQIVENAIKAGCSSISCSRSEPTIFAEYALEIMRLARNAGLRNIWVSNGYMSTNCLDAILPWLDAINIDLRSMDDAYYRRICGARVEPVLENLRYIYANGVHLEITTPITAGHSDSPAMLERLAGFIARDLGPEIPWHPIPFHPRISGKPEESPASNAAALASAGTIGRNAGLLYVYSGTAQDDTVCRYCGKKLVSRRKMLGHPSAVRYDATGACPSCKALSPIKD